LVASLVEDRALVAASAAAAADTCPVASAAAAYAIVHQAAQIASDVADKMVALVETILEVAVMAAAAA